MTKARVLVIDDDELVRNMLGQSLSARGFNVDAATDGCEGLNMIKQRAYDVVVCDIMMPEKDGLEVIIHTRKHHPGLPVIAISAPGNQMFLESARGLGAAVVFDKPFDVSELCLAIDQLLARAEA